MWSIIDITFVFILPHFDPTFTKTFELQIIGLARSKTELHFLPHYVKKVCKLLPRHRSYVEHGLQNQFEFFGYYRPLLLSPGILGNQRAQVARIFVIQGPI